MTPKPTKIVKRANEEGSIANLQFSSLCGATDTWKKNYIMGRMSRQHGLLRVAPPHEGRKEGEERMRDGRVLWVTGALGSGRVSQSSSS